MKDKLKNTLEHEVELLGRSISVLAIAGLLVVGGASAALLSSFGTIDGQANVDQAITVNNPGQTELGTFGADFQGSNSVTAGDVISGVNTDSTTTEASFTISNNLEESYTPEFTTTVDGDKTTDLQFTWDSDGFSGDEVVRTTYANYFADAGVEDDYQPSISTGDDGVVTLTTGSTDDADRVGTWDEAIDMVNADNSHNKIYVESGTYDVDGDIDTIDSSESVTISGAGPESVTLNEAGATMDSTTLLRVDGATDVVIEGLTIEGLFQNDGANAVSVLNSDSAEIRNNQLNGQLDQEDDQGEWDTTAIIVTDTDQVTVSHNELDVNSRVVGVALNGGNDQLSDAEVNENEIVAGTGVQEFGDVTGTNVSFNQFDTTDVSISSVDGTQVSANDNFFAQGTWGSTNSNNFEGDVDASFQTVGSIDSGESVDVAPVHEFALMANGADSYSLSTKIR